MVLFDDVVEVLALPYLDAGSIVTVVVVRNAGLVGTALVDGDLGGCAVAINGSAQKAQRCSLVALGRQQKVDCVTLLVDGAVRPSD